MLKLRTEASRPCPIANANAIRAPIPSTSNMPATQPTRARATPPRPARRWVARPPKTPRVRPTAAKQDDQHEVVPRGWKSVQVLQADEEHECERNDHAPAVELPLPGLAEHQEHECRVEEILRSSHAVIMLRRLLAVISARVETRVDLPSTHMLSRVDAGLRRVARASPEPVVGRVGVLSPSALIPRAGRLGPRLDAEAKLVRGISARGAAPCSRARGNTVVPISPDLS